VYRYVVGQDDAVGRDQAASALDLARSVAAFHLDKLVDRGLLRSHYARPPGRSGPGAGRSAKYYEPSELEVDVSIPERRYDLVGHLLLRAIQSETTEEPALATAVRVAREAGLDIGQRARRDRRLGRVGAERALTAAAELLDEHGFEPRRPDPQQVALANCPFHSLAQEAPELVCQMNQAFVDGLLRGLGNDTVEAALQCTPGDCCVTLRAPSGTSRTSQETDS
jgi:predicted ArsR family transcriptional regulator